MKRAATLVGLAYAFSLVLHVLQTVLLQAIPYDTPSYALVVKGLLVLFPLADAALFVALVALAVKAPEARPFAITGAVLVPLATCAGLVGALLAEPVLGLGVAAATTMALGSLVHRRALAAAAAITIALWFVARLGGVAAGSTHAVVAAWARWGVDALRFGALSALAFSVPVTPASAPLLPTDPYRAPAPGAPAPAATTHSRDALVRLAAALRLYRFGFALRAGNAFLAALLLVLLELSATRDLPILLLFGPVTSLASAILLLIANVRMRAVKPALSAAALMVLVVLADAAMVLFGIAQIFDRGPRSAFRHLQESLLMQWPIVAVASGVALVLVAVALGRMGRAFETARIVSRAAWVKALACFAGASTVAFAVLVLEGERGPRSMQDAMKVCAALLGFAVFAATNAVVVLQILLVSTAIKVLDEKARS